LRALLSLEKELEHWRAPDYIDFKVLPAISPKGWAATGAQTFFTASALGILDKIHVPLFSAIHDEHRPGLSSDPEAIADFFADFGVDEETFHKTWNSFYVKTKMRAATGTFTTAGLSSVPVVIVNGKYLTSPSMAGGAKNMLEVVEFLAKREHEAH
jgi:protein dithiol oxidoreductase (disulfide-forming)